MKWTEERRKAYGIDLDTMSEATMAPRLRITINGYSTLMSLTREFIEDLKWQTPNSEVFIDSMIDDEIERHPEFKRIVRKKKLEQIERLDRTDR